MKEITACEYAPRCTGCTEIGRSYSSQLNHKKDILLSALSAVEFPFLGSISMVGVQPEGLRDRVDLVIDGAEAPVKIGLFDKDRGVVDLKTCPQMSPELLAWFREFREDLPPIQRGSVRLRVNGKGLRGVWLDFSNVDVKTLMTDGSWLRRLAKKSIVEVGQRRKRLADSEPILKLLEPELDSWFFTQTTAGNPSALYTTVGGFTQPSLLANKTLVQELIGLLRNTKAERWLELCAGSGNLTVPLASLKKFVYATEMDDLALVGLKKTIYESNLSDRVQLKRLNLYRSNSDTLKLISEVQGILVDPPRSGLGDFLKVLEGSHRKPIEVIYISCFAESLAADLKRLGTMGYQIRSLVGVDQFPQTLHCEYLCHLELKENT